MRSVGRLYDEKSIEWGSVESSSENSVSSDECEAVMPQHLLPIPKMPPERGETRHSRAQRRGGDAPEPEVQRDPRKPFASWLAFGRCELSSHLRPLLSESQRYFWIVDEVDAELVLPSPAPRPPEVVRPGWWAGFG